MYHSYPEKIVRIVKDHSCWGCGKVFTKGVFMLKQSGVHEGQGFWNGWFCDRCASFLKTKSSFDWGDYQDGLHQGDLTEHDDYESHTVTPLSALIINNK